MTAANSIEAKEIGRPVTLIVDNLKVHHAKVMGDWLAAKKEKCGFTLEYIGKGK